ncbi:UDP-N-acetylmuramoyl-L-alanyl-D-glutamate--2,6-diaminopimelate ligase, partial [Candidatus Bathyarchaeota archaeon]|nr:UDP-N-acetylmuramoyl-L-alanyl-D-glutamate--2,6-diaminopimelate ligase [Candidatus Bathyarchaeota archaeon]
EIPNSRGLHLYVDFAHTPNALDSVLKNLASKKRKGKKLIVVFGAASQRDIAKRPMMGKIASQYADQIILTSEDPRSEDPTAIAQEILHGIPRKSRGKTTIIPDRQKAITHALSIAKQGDWVVSCGKGHEESMNLDGRVETPWSEHQAFAKALKDTA